MTPSIFSNDEQIDYIELYSSGFSASRLARQKGCSKHTVIKMLRKNGVHIRLDNGKKILPEDVIVDRYLNNESITALAKFYNTGRGVISRILDRKNIIKKSRGWFNRHYSLDEHVFDDPLSYEAKYWIGFLMADCSIDDKQHRITTALAPVDQHHLLKLSSFFKTNKPLQLTTTNLKNKVYHGFKLDVYSGNLCDKLFKFGVVSNKSLTANVKHLEDDRDFWRGVIDGDGCLCDVKQNKCLYPTLHLAGSMSICSQFANFVNKHLGDYKPNVRKFRKSSEAFQTTINGIAAIRIVNILYYNCCIALDRKYNKASKWMQQM